MKYLKWITCITIALLCMGCSEKDEKFIIQPSENFTTDFTQIPALRNNYAKGYYEYTDQVPYVRVDIPKCKIPRPCPLSEIECTIPGLEVYPRCFELTEDLKEIKEMEWIDYSEVLLDEKEKIELSRMQFDVDHSGYRRSKDIDSSLINEFVRSFEVISFYPIWFEIDYFGQGLDGCYIDQEDCYYDSVGLWYKTNTKNVSISVTFYEKDSPYGYMKMDACLSINSEGKCENYLYFYAYVEASELLELSNSVEKDEKIPFN